MEHHRKYVQHRQPQRIDKQKEQFFREVFLQCEQKFSSKQFEFFIKCMIPHRTNNNRSLSAKKKGHNGNSYQQRQKQTNINDINPYVLTMPRKINFYQQKSIENLRPQRKNKRLLTTPTERIQKDIRFNNYQDYSLYKKMQMHKQGLTSKDRQNTMPNKMYNPQPLFYPFRKSQACKIVLNTTGKFRSKTKMRFQQHLRFKYDQGVNQKQNSEFIPDNFIEIIRCSSNNRYSKTGSIRKTLF